MNPKMEPLLKLIMHWKPYVAGFASASVVFLLAGRSPLRGDRFEFHPADPYLYRCNRATGDVDFTYPNSGHWRRITEGAKQ